MALSTRPGTRDALRAALAVALSGGAIYLATLTFGARSGIDFYQYWGVGAALRLGDRALSTPYEDVEGFAAVLDRHAETAGDERLLRANLEVRETYPRGLDPNNSPLLYMAFSILPTGYSSAFAVFLGLRVLLLLGALYLLVRENTGPALLLTVLAVVALYHPLGSDARVGNLAVYQLFAIVALARGVEATGGSPRPRAATLGAAGAITGIAFLALAKPNVAPVAAALALSLALRIGRRDFARAALVAVVPTLVLVLLPCLYFGSWSVWGEWVGFLDPGTKLALNTFAFGNYSSALLLAGVLGIPPVGAATVASILLVLSAAAALGLRRGVSGRVAAALRDPLLTASLAVCALLATSPLVWFHYYVLALTPALWLLATPRSGVPARALAGSALFLASGAIGLVPGLAPAVPMLVTLSWIPLWAAGLLVAARRDVLAEAAI